MAAIATLALGIGANTAIFGLANATLLKPVAAAAPERLVSWPWSSAYPDYVEYAKRFDLFEGALAWDGGRVGISTDGTATELAQAVFVSGNAFTVLGVGAAAGRTLVPTDDVMNGPLVAVLSHDYWRSRFGGSETALGRTLRVNSRTVTIVGVAAEGYRGLSIGQSPALYLPLAAAPQVRTGFLASPQMFETRNFVWLNVVARLRQDVTAVQASAAVESMYRTLNPPAAGATPERLTLVPLTTRALGAGRADTIRQFVVLLLAVVAITLLIGCANLANLLLARGAARRQEIGVRLAIGATRAQIARQLMLESLVLAGLGGLAGLGVAALTLRLLSVYQLPGGVDIAELSLSVNRDLLAAALGLSTLTALLFGLLPAWRAAKTDVMVTLRGEARGSSAPTRWRAALVAAQVALSLVLLAGCGLFMRSLVNALAIPTGFNVDGVVTASVTPSLARYELPRAREFYDLAVQRVRALPGVRAAGWTSLIPVSGAMMNHVRIDGFTPPGNEPIEFHFSYVGPGYFAAAGTRLLEGRAFAPTDTSSSTPVAIISRAAAAKYWPGRRALGGRIAAGDEWRTVVGIVENTTVERLEEEAAAYAYYPFEQVPAGLWTPAAGAHLFARTDGDASDMTAAIAGLLRSVDPEMPVHNVVPFAAHVRELVMPQRLGVTLLAFFSVLALSLAAVGIYGVASYVAELRTRELGIRIALGADASDIRALVLRHGLVPAALGVVAGLGVATWAARLIQAFLHDISPHDPVTFVAVSLALMSIAGAATWVPARRAARIDPVAALRAQ